MKFSFSDGDQRSIIISIIVGLLAATTAGLPRESDGCGERYGSEYGSLPTKKKDTAEHDKSAVEKSNGITVDNKSILIQICLA